VPGADPNGTGERRPPPAGGNEAAGAAKIHGYGVPNPIGVLKDLLDGLRREAMAPPAPAEVVASPIVEAIPVAEPPAKTVVTEPRRTLVERLKARREAAGRDA
jgi:hypothetical protein